MISRFEKGWKKKIENERLELIINILQVNKSLNSKNFCDSLTRKNHFYSSSYSTYFYRIRILFNFTSGNEVEKNKIGRIFPWQLTNWKCLFMFFDQQSQTSGSRQSHIFYLKFFCYFFFSKRVLIGFDFIERQKSDNSFH